MSTREDPGRWGGITTDLAGELVVLAFTAPLWAPFAGWGWRAFRWAAGL